MKVLERLKRAARLLLLAVAGWLARQAADKTLRELLPVVFLQLDQEIRNEIGPGNFVPIEQLIRRSIYSATKRVATYDQVRAVSQLFDPIELGDPK